MIRGLKLSRRRALTLATTAGVTGYSSRILPAFGGVYPSQPITFIIPDGLGGTTSALVREYASGLSKYLSLVGYKAYSLFSLCRLYIEYDLLALPCIELAIPGARGR